MIGNEKRAIFFNKLRIVFFATGFSGSTFAMQSTDSDLKKVIMKQRPTDRTFSGQSRLAALILVLLCTCLPLAGQGFEKSFGGPKADLGRAVLQTNDHGFIEVGVSEGELGDDNDLDIFVVRTDVDGTVVWEKRFDDGFQEFGEDVVQTPEGDFLVIGSRQQTAQSADETFLIKISRRGELLFSKAYSVDGVNERGRQIIPTAAGGYLITGTRNQPSSTRKDVLAIKVDDDGDEEWRATYGEYFDHQGVGAINADNGEFIIGANVEDGVGTDSDLALYRISGTGEMVWHKTLNATTDNEQMEDIIRTSDGQLAFVGSTNDFNTAVIAKADLNGELLWFEEVDASDFDDEFNGLIEEDNGDNLVAVGQTTPTAANFDVLMVKVNATSGQRIWERRLGDETSTDIGQGLATTLDGGYALAAFSSRIFLVEANDMTLFKTDNFGDHQTNYLQGRVYYPAANDCGPYRNGDLGLTGWLVKAESETATFFGSTDSLGNYNLQVESDNYEVSLLRKNDRWNICDPAAFMVDLTTEYDTSFHDFALQPAIDCPLLEVALSATPAIQCDTQRITISYGNSGTALATEAQVNLILDDHLTFLNAGNQTPEQDGQALTFDLGDLAPGNEGVIELTARVACNDIVEGQAVSSQAMIFPILNCAPASADWDGSSIVVTSRCDLNDGISFTITNVGDNPMTQTGNYVIVEDIILLEAAEFDPLNPDESLDVPVPLPEGDVSTYRMIAAQSTGHPGSLFPTAVVEGCQTANSTGFTTGFVAQFSDNDGDLNLDILTQEVVALEDGSPIQLTAYPRGYQDSIIIPKTDIEYTVFFALPDNDNSYERVVIRDTLPEALDFNSLEMGAASHPYDFVLYQDGILKITFDSIRIFSGGGTGEADAVTRTGYATYRLSQKPNTTTGTVIRNRAAVYFDYESPVFSREVRHVVGCNDLFESNCLLTSDRNLPTATGVNISINPNPIKDRTTVRVNGWEQAITEFRFNLYDASGRKVFQQMFTGDQFEFLRPQIASGAYFYEVSGSGYLIGNGQLIFQ